MFSQWCFKIKKSLKKQRLRNGSATESIYRSPWELHTSARSQLRCCIYHAGLANWHDDEGSSLLLSSRPPQYVQRSGTTSARWFATSFKQKKRDLYKSPDVPNYLNLKLIQWNGPKKTYLIGAKSIVPDFASASEVSFGHFMTCFKKEWPGSRCVS